MCINAGIEKIVYLGNYPDKLSSEILKEAEIEVVNFDMKGWKYERD